MKNKTKKILSIILNLLIIAFTIYSISCFFIVGGSANMQVNGSMCFRYYTILSNMLVALSSVFVIFDDFFEITFEGYLSKKWVHLLKYVATISVTVTFVTTAVFLAPFSPDGYFSLFKGPAFFLHLITPIISILSLLLLENKFEISKKEKLLGISTTVVYSIVYFIMVVIIKQWPDFYGFTFGGRNYLIPVSMIAMYTLTLGISILYRFVNNRRIKNDTTR